MAGPPVKDKCEDRDIVNEAGTCIPLKTNLQEIAALNMFARSPTDIREQPAT